MESGSLSTSTNGFRTGEHTQRHFAMLNNYMTIKLFITCSSVQRLWATRHSLYFVTSLPAAATRFPLRSHQGGSSEDALACSGMLCSQIIIQHYKKIWCGVAQTQCVPAWEWWAVVKCFAWVWTEINGGATSEQLVAAGSKAFSFGYLIVSLSWILFKKIVIFTIVTPLIPWPLFKDVSVRKAQRLDRRFVAKSLSQ